MRELNYLAQLPNLKVLWLWDNPICQHPLYRQYCIKLLPNLVKLDSVSVSNEERQQAKQLKISESDILPTPQMQQLAAQEESKRQQYGVSSSASLP